MAEEQTYSVNTEQFTSIMEQDFTDETVSCELMSMSKIKPNNIEINEQYIPASILPGFMEAVMATFSSEMSKMTTAVVKTHNRSYVEFQAHTESLINQRNGQNKQISIDDNSKFRKTNLKSVDHAKIVKNFASVMQQFVTDEITKFVLVEKTESNNEESNENLMTIPMLLVVMGDLITTFSSDLTNKLESLTEYLEYKLNTLSMDFEARMERLTEKENELLKKKAIMESLNKENNDMRKKLECQETKAKKLENEFDHIHKDRNLSTMHQRDTEYNNECHKELSNFIGNDKSIIICRFASRNRKYEILSTRKKAKGGNKTKNTGTRDRAEGSEGVYIHTS